MKKIYIIICLVFLSHNVSSAKYLIRLVYNYKVWSGHGVEMYFSEDDLEQLLNRLNKIDTLTERNLLAAFVLPIDERNNSMDICLRDDEKIGDLREYFSSLKTKTINLDGESHRVKMTVIYADYSLCHYDPEVGFPCDCSYTKEAVLITIPNQTCWQKKDKKKLKLIIKRLETLVIW
jgi:hypothetical protein